MYLVMIGNYFSSLKHNNYLDSFFLSLLIIKWSGQQVKTTSIKLEYNYGVVTETSDMSGKVCCYQVFNCDEMFLLST